MNTSSHATATLSPHLIDAREAARLCGVSVATWYRMDSAGRTPSAVRLSSRTVRWRRAEVLEWIDAGCPPRYEWESTTGRRLFRNVTLPGALTVAMICVLALILFKEFVPSQDGLLPITLIVTAGSAVSRPPDRDI